MRFSDSVSRSFLEYSSPAWRNAYPTSDLNKFVDYQDPTYIGFYVKFNDLGKKPLTNAELSVSFDEWPGGLLYDESHPDSAIAYLTSIGEYTRAQMLREFIQGIQILSEELPWYFLKVSGLEEIWKIEPGESFRGKDKKIVFEMLESIDLKITYLLDLYRKATFDSVYMRHMLPENMRHFEMELIITEIRSMQRPASVLPATNDPKISQPLNDYKNPVKAPSPFNINIPGLAERGLQSAVSAMVPNSQWAAGLSNALISTLNRDPGSYSNFPVLMQTFDDLATFMIFKFSHCEFMAFEEAPTYFTSLGKTPETVAANKMVIKTPIIRETNTYGLLGAILEDTPSQVTRNENYVDQLFWRKPGPDSVRGETSGQIIDELDGIKKENFGDAALLQRQHQNQLKEENTRLGGLLGGLLNAATTIAGAALNRVVQNTVSQALLGNVYSRVFPPPVAEAIAKQVALEAPPVLKEALTKVALEENYSQNPISGKTELVSPPVGTATSTNAVLTGPPVQQENLTTVELAAPLIMAATSTNVEFTAPVISQASSTKTDLQGPPLAQPSSSKVDLTGPEKPIPSAGKVDLIENPVSSLSGDKVNLIAAAPSNVTPGSVELQGVPASSSDAGKVTMEGPGATPNNPGSVDLQGVTISSSNPGQVELDSPAVSNSQTTKVDLQAVPVQQEGVSPVELTAPSISMNTNKSVDLTGAPINNEIGAKYVELSAAPVQNPELLKTPLEGAGSNNEIQKTVELKGPEINKDNPGNANLSSPNIDLVEKNIGDVPLKSPQRPSNKP